MFRTGEKDGGFSILPSELRLRRALAANEVFEYESGAVDFADRKVHYIHILNVWTAIERLALQRYKAGNLLFWPTQPLDQLRVTISLDKGGSYTKLMLTWLNSDQPQSEDAALILGVYEGPENHSLMELVFGDLLSDLAEKPRGWSIRASHPKGVELDPMRPMVSGDCGKCKAARQVGLTTTSGPSLPSSIAITDVQFFYGGDTVLLNEAQGLAGHASTYPCPICTVKKDALKPGDGQLHARRVMPPAAPGSVLIGRCSAAFKGMEWSISTRSPILLALPPLTVRAVFGDVSSKRRWTVTLFRRRCIF